jgi:hypothetical protein
LMSMPSTATAVKGPRRRQGLALARPALMVPLMLVLVSANLVFGWISVR